MNRRCLLTTVGAGSLSLTGCLGVPWSPMGEDLPEDCPKSQRIGVEWPHDLDRSAASSFLERYERAYYEHVVIDSLFEPESRLFGFDGWIIRVEAVNAHLDGWRAHLSGIVNVIRGDLAFEARPADPPEGAQITPIEEIDDERLSDLLRKAATSGQADDVIGPSRSDGYLELFGNISAGFDLTHVGDTHTLYIDVDGTTVELEVTWFAPNRDHFWDAWYYVDANVVWRSGDKNVDPRDGDLLECRTAN